MDTQILLQWMTPVMLVGFAILFMTASRLDPSIDGPRLLAGSYLTGAVAFSIELMFAPQNGSLRGFSLETLCYLAGAALFAAALFARVGQKPPIKILVLICVAGWGTDLYLASIDEQAFRTQLTGCLTAVMFAMPLILVKRHLGRGIDIALMALVFGLSVSLLASAILLSPALDEPGIVYEQSALSAAVNVIINVFSVFGAALLLVDYVHARVRRLLRDAHHDPLTGLLNRRGFEEPCERLIDSANASGRPGALLIADIDHFKSINDRFGHTKGDEVIEALAQALQSNVPEGALAARLGGEEVCVAIDFCTPDMARIVAESVRSAFATNVSALKTHEPQPLACTVSVGISQFCKTYQRTFIAADEALYSAKAAGRDQSVLAAPSNVRLFRVA